MSGGLKRGVGLSAPFAGGAYSLLIMFYKTKQNFPTLSFKKTASGRLQFHFSRRIYREQAAVIYRGAGVNSFSLHLKELRYRALYFLFSLLSTFLTGTYYSSVLTHLICTPFSGGNSSPECTLFIWTHVTEGLYAALNVSLMYTLFFCVPALLYQFYSFFMPSCYQEERKNVNIILFFAALLLFLSIYGGFAILLPKICYFLQQFQYESKCMEIKLQARIGPAVGFLSSTFLFTVLFFQMPVLLAVGIYWQVIDCDFLKEKRRYVLFSLLLISSLLSPPDLSSQCTLAALIALFYELFLWSALFHQRWTRLVLSKRPNKPAAREWSKE